MIDRICNLLLWTVVVAAVAVALFDIINGHIGAVCVGLGLAVVANLLRLSKHNAS